MFKYIKNIYKYYKNIKFKQDFAQIYVFTIE